MLLHPERNGFRAFQKDKKRINPISKSANSLLSTRY